MSGCAYQQADVIDWHAINQSIESKESVIDWASINRSLPSHVEVNVDSDDVQRVISAFAPVLRAGIRAGLKAQAKFVAEAAIRRMTGRLD